MHFTKYFALAALIATGALAVPVAEPNKPKPNPPPKPAQPTATTVSQTNQCGNNAQPYCCDTDGKGAYTVCKVLGKTPRIILHCRLIRPIPDPALPAARRLSAATRTTVSKFAWATRSSAKRSNLSNQHGVRIWRNGTITDTNISVNAYCKQWRDGFMEGGKGEQKTYAGSIFNHADVLGHIGFACLVVYSHSLNSLVELW
ncbi:hypothetical protein H2200_000265 [Cladophialophora chaetospira]|uniref:Hydrophobin n=1 Tax=Cladophialophora chaetospira TaxID=386627 RepID=A0AA38XNF5_9EURO|nr:hypothetical protein H2200_000265 [Cladophialophora chaetospira]